MRDRKNALKAQGCQVQLKMSADTNINLMLFDKCSSCLFK